MVNIALASNGFGEMAISGSIAGPLFNLMFGMGLSFILESIKSAGSSFNFAILVKEQILISLTLIVLTINLVRLLLQGFISK